MTRDALVVGVNQYPFLKDTPTSKAKHLKTPASDAEAIAQLLESCAGNEVWSVRRLPEVYNPKPCIDQKGKVKQEELKTAISELFHPKTQYLPEVALLFFSGHGFRREHNAQTEGFLATSDVRLDRDKYGISLNWLREQMLTSPVKKQIVWLDSCHSGELLNFLTEAEFDNWLVGGDRLLIAACRDDKVAYGLGEYGVLTKVLLDALNPEQNPEGESISSYTVKRFIEKKLSSNTALRNQFPLVRHFGEEIIFWQGNKLHTQSSNSLASDVTLIDASLDPQDSPYQESLKGEVKKIKKKGELKITGVSPTNKNYSYDFPTIDFKFQNTGKANALLWKFAICVIQAEIDPTPVLDFKIECSAEHELVLSVTNNGWGTAHDCNIQIDEPVLNHLFSELTRQTRCTIKSGERQTVFKLKLDMVNPHDLEMLSRDFVNIRNIHFRFSDKSSDDTQIQGLIISPVKVKIQFKDDKDNEKKQEQKILNYQKDIVITKRGFFERDQLVCPYPLTSDVTYITIIDPQKGLHQKHYPISRKIPSGDVERFHIMIGSQMSCRLRLKFQFLIGKKQIIESEEFDISIWNQKNSYSSGKYQDGDALQRIQRREETEEKWKHIVEHKLKLLIFNYPFTEDKNQKDDDLGFLFDF